MGEYLREYERLMYISVLEKYLDAEHECIIIMLNEHFVTNYLQEMYSLSLNVSETQSMYKNT